MSAATVAASADPSPSTRAPIREPWPARLVVLTFLSVLAALMLVGSEAIAETWASKWHEIIFWAVLVFLVDLFPISVGRLSLTLEIPLVLAAALLYPPAVAAGVAFIGAVDRRELDRRITLWRALFNRSQIALSVLAAGSAFRLVADGLGSWPWAIAGTVFAVAADYLVNVSMVALHQRALHGIGLGEVLRGLKVGSMREFLLTYFAYGALAIVMAYLFRKVGAWATVALLIPTLVTRRLLIKAQQLQVSSRELVRQRRLLENMFKRLDDERLDERLRIAGDLHDDVQQALTHILMLSRFARDQARVGRVDSRDLENLVKAADGSIASLRKVVHDVRKSPLGRGGLLPTLGGLIRELRLDWRMRIEADLPGQLSIEPGVQIVVYQVAREALMNAVKHSNGSAIRLVVRKADDRIVLVVEDDGSGFDPSSVDASLHFGLGLMQERATAIGGQVSLCAAPGQGTTVRAEFPLGELPRVIAEGDDENRSENRDLSATKG